MSFRELEYVLAIEQHRNISKAAKALYISQPSLSKFLHEYESALGMRLFERVGNRYLLTYAGERYMEYARQILRIKADMNNELSEIASNAKGRLAIGYQFNRSSYMVPLTMPKFKALYPQATVILQEDSSENLEKMLLDGAVDLVIFNYTSRHPQLRYDVLSHEEILLMVPECHPLVQYGRTVPDSRYPWIDLHLFANEPFILQRSDQTTGRIARELLAATGIEPPVAMQTRSIEGTLHLVENEFGCGFIVETHLKYILSQNRVRSFSVGNPKKSIDLVAARRKSDYFSRCAEDYIKIICEYLEEPQISN